MSVPTYRRTQSKMEFISIAEELEAFTSAMCAKFPERKKDFGVKQTYQLASDITNFVVEANSWDLRTYSNLREVCFRNALACLSKLTIKLNILKKYKSSLEGRHWEKWGLLIGQEVNLINNIMKSDKKRIMGA